MGTNSEKLTIEEFRGRLLEQLSSMPDCETGIETRKVKKNNGIILEGIFIRKPENSVSPAFYVEYLYKEYVKGASIKQLADYIIKHCNCDDILQDNVVDFYKDFECVKERVLYRIINYGDNESFLKEVPHRKFLDFAIIYYCKIEDTGMGKGNITVFNEHLEMWGVSEEDLYSFAVVNTPKQLPENIIDLEEMIKDISGSECFEQGEYFEKCNVHSGVDSPGENFELFVLTNCENYYGACGILYEEVLKKFAYTVNKNFYILPSSVHEVLLLFTDYKDDEEVRRLQDMVFEVNNSQVELEDRLSYNVYYYNRFENNISIL